MYNYYIAIIINLNYTFGDVPYFYIQNVLVLRLVVKYVFH